jgi:hypothetical protein
VKLIKEDPQVFIIRFWQEPREIHGAAPQLRGVICHLNSGDEKYLKDPDELLAFILLYLDAPGKPPAQMKGPPGEPEDA